MLKPMNVFELAEQTRKQRERRELAWRWFVGACLGIIAAGLLWLFFVFGLAL